MWGFHSASEPSAPPVELTPVSQSTTGVKLSSKLRQLAKKRNEHAKPLAEKWASVESTNLGMRPGMGGAKKGSAV